jgi:hypothetical protein
MRRNREFWTRPQHDRPERPGLMTAAAIRASRSTCLATGGPSDGSLSRSHDEEGECPKHRGSNDGDVPCTHFRYPIQRAFQCYGRRKRCPNRERACRQWRIPSISTLAQVRHATVDFGVFEGRAFL